MNDRKTSGPSDAPTNETAARDGSIDATVVASSPSETALNTRLAGIELCAGTVLRDRFVLETVIGRGGMGIVYRARDLRREEAGDRKRHVAIKVLGDQFKQHPQAMIALQREARRAQQLAHPNIATVYDFDREGDIAYLCMELLNGRGLNVVLRDRASQGMRLEEAMPIIRGMVGGLAYAHQRGIVHADFKPGNVYLNNDGGVKILDFGIARVIPLADQTATRFDPGRFGALTPSYASCEMFQRQDPDPRDDVYGLACVSYELLAGKHPFQRIASTEARDNGMVPPSIAGLTRRQNQALRRGLAFSRDARTESVREFLDELSPVTRQGVSKSALALAAVGVVSLGAAIVIAISQRPVDPAEEDAASTGSEAVMAQDTLDSEAENAIAARDDPEPKPVSPETRERIDNVLEVATMHLAIGRLVEPDGSNAAEAFAYIYNELQPGNRAARDGLDAVAERLREQVRSLVDGGDRAGAVELVEAGLKHAPDHPDMLELREELQR